MTKKILFLILFQIAMFAQANVGSKDSQEERSINGISVTEDIGGVDISYFNTKNPHAYIVKLKFTNHNDFKVTVLYKVINEYGDETGTIVLNPGESKFSDKTFYGNRIHNVVSITRELKQKPRENFNYNSRIK